MQKLSAVKVLSIKYPRDTYTGIISFRCRSARAKLSNIPCKARGLFFSTMCQTMSNHPRVFKSRYPVENREIIHAPFVLAPFMDCPNSCPDPLAPLFAAPFDKFPLDIHGSNSLANFNYGIIVIPVNIGNERKRLLCKIPPRPCPDFPAFQI